MAELYANFRIRAIDNFSAVLGKLRRGVSTASSTISRAQENANRSFSVAANMNQAAMQVGRFNRVSREVLFAPIQAFAKFEKSMSDVRAVTAGITEGEFEQLSNKAQEIGLKTKWMSFQVAEGMEFLAIAGFDFKKQMQTIGPMVDLATAAGMDMGRTADIVSDLMQTFGKDASQAGDFTDVMTSTFTNANVTLETLFETMKFVGSETRSLGLSFRQTAAMAAVLGSAGLKGSLAGTGLAQMLTNLVAPRGKRKKAMAALGVNVEDPTTGGLRDPSAIFIDIIEKMKGKTLIARKRSLGEIFTRRAVKNILVLLQGEKEGGMKAITDKLRNAAGSTSKVAAVKMANMAGKSVLFKSAVDALNISIGELVTGPFGDLVVSITDIVKGLTKFAKENPNLTKTLFWVFAGVVLATHALQGMLAAIGIFFAAKGIITLAGTFYTLGAEALVAAGGISGMATATWAAVAPFLVALGVVSSVTIAIGLLVAAIAELAASWETLNVLEGMKGMAQFDQENFQGASILKLFGVNIGGDESGIDTGFGSLAGHYKERIGAASGATSVGPGGEAVRGKIQIEVLGDKNARVTAVGEGPLDLLLDSGAGQFNMMEGL